MDGTHKTIRKIVCVSKTSKIDNVKDRIEFFLHTNEEITDKPKGTFILKAYLGPCEASVEDPFCEISQ